MLEITNLYKTYGSFTAVNNLCMSVQDGSIFGFVGPNGAGKTTTMKIMSGLLAATSGSVVINGIDVIKHPRKLCEKIGYMPDFFGVYDNLRVDEYMDFYAGAYRIPAKERNPIISNLLELVGLTYKKDSYVDSLSRGMKQRLCLARSLVHDPDVLILDEPASGLDPRARIEMKEILKQLKSLGKTIIISSHILTEMAELCTEIGIIDKGQVKAVGSVNDIMLTIQKHRIIFIKPMEISEKMLQIIKENPYAGDISEMVENVEFAFTGDNLALSKLVKELVTNDIPIVTVKEKEGNLEELFMQITGGAEIEQN